MLVVDKRMIVYRNTVDTGDGIVVEIYARNSFVNNFENNGSLYLNV